jgi:hypothetical protein
LSPPLGKLQLAVAQDSGLDSDTGTKQHALAKRIGRSHEEPNVRMALQRLDTRGVVELVPGAIPMRYRLTTAFRSVQIDEAV